MGSLQGTLIVVGTGIQVGHLTAEARGWIEAADRVLYCVSDAATERLIKRLNSSSESLYGFYGNNKPRIETYNEMIARILECLRQGLKVCAVFYGHPGIFVYPSHEAIRQARLEGYDASMLPAISSLDSLFADLGVDPAAGCQLVEATDLLIRNRFIDTEGSVIIWQGGAVGDIGFNFQGFDGRNIPILQEALEGCYGSDFECVIYEAAQFPVCEPVVKRTRVGNLAASGLTSISTIYLPAKTRAPADLDMVARLGIGSVSGDVPVRMSKRSAQEAVKPLRRSVGPKTKRVRKGGSSCMHR